jgi:putative SOS response-associated peptidase YedK
MCGRDSAFYTWKQIHAFSQPLTIEAALPDPTPNYYRAPTHKGSVIVAGDGVDCVAREMRCGLIPFWVKDAHGRAYNRTSHLVERRRMKQAWANYSHVLAMECK